MEEPQEQREGAPAGSSARDQGRETRSGACVKAAGPGPRSARRRGTLAVVEDGAWPGAAAHTGVSVSTIQRPPRRGLVGRCRPDRRRRRASRDGGSGPAARNGSRPSGAAAGGARDERARRSSSIVRVSRSSRRPSVIMFERGSIRRHVARLAERDAEALPLADGVPGRAGVLPHPRRRRRRRPARARAPSRRAIAERVAVVAAGHEADLLALGLVGGRQAEAAGDLADLGLRQLAEREPGCARAGPGGGRTGSTSGPCPRRAARASARAARRRVPTRAGRSGRSRPPRTRTGGAPGRAAPRTSRRVAVDARARRPAVEVGAEERLDARPPSNSRSRFMT